MALRKNNRFFAVGALLLAGIFLLVMPVARVLVKPSPPPAELQGVLRTQLDRIGAFQLTGHSGQLITQDNFRSKWSFVFFGYTSCPDVCPATLQVLNAVHQLASEQRAAPSDNMQVMFISVDPGRDTLEKLGQYVTHFNTRFIGATADKKHIDRVASLFGAAYLPDVENRGGYYMVNHTSAIFLVDPRGRLVATFSQPHRANNILSQYAKINAYFSGID
ncbi:MAG: SCO family protein [Gammaproteobacteria bacterium]|nr:SCO family protein [Gammaproteobacteria bacterium]